ncbi:CAP domain-containing protein [Nonomuraea salmonea]|uniref:CAP domain-containing protein n=1 Tax=Nonomuraea salmonea TaxID=46181 RepID=UPI002FE8C9E4
MPRERGQAARQRRTEDPVLGRPPRLLHGRAHAHPHQAGRPRCRPGRQERGHQEGPPHARPGLQAGHVLRRRHRLPRAHREVQAGQAHLHPPGSGTPTPVPSPPATGTPTPKPGNPTAAPVTPPPANGGGVGSTEENEVVRLVNAERAKGGCRPLQHNAQLHTAAYGHSADMAAKNYFAHNSKDGRSFMDRIKAAGFTGGNAWAENIAMGQRTPAEVMRSWMNSAGHRTNIMNCKYTLIGVGAAKNSRGQIYWTQDFAAR